MAAMMQDPAMMQAVMGMMGGSPPPTATPPAEGAGVPAVPLSAGMSAPTANPMAAMMQDPGMMQAMMGMMGGAGMPSAGAGASNPMGRMDPAMIGQMMQNPVMQQMMNNMFQNPAMLQQMIQSNPMLQQMSQQNPMMAQMMSNPAVLQGAMQMMQNPQMIQMLQNPQMMQALGGTPGAMRGLPAPTATPPAGDAGAPAVPPANPMAAMMQAIMGMMGGSPPPTA